MQLKEYLEGTRYKKESRAARYRRFAARLDVSEHTVVKWVNGQRGITDGMKLQIQHFTHGQVTINDMVRR